MMAHMDSRHRIPALLLTITLCLSVFLPLTVTTAAQTTAAEEVSSADARELLRALTGSTALSAETHADLDHNGDGRIDSADARALLLAAAGVSVPHRTTTTTITTITTTITTTTSTTSTTTQAKQLTPLAYEEYYGRTCLYSDGENYVAAYDAVHEAAMTYNEDLLLWQYQLTPQQFQRVLYYYRNDHPEVYWLNSGFEYMEATVEGTTYIYSMQQSYLFSRSEIALYNSRLEERVNELLEGITDDMPMAQRERIVHDRLLLSAVYDTTYAASNNHDLLGVLLYGTGVCESYARAFQYLMQRCGIPCILPTGASYAGELHMWNAVQLDGVWYQVDPTWNDPTVEGIARTDYITYQYYNVTTEEMQLSHVQFRDRGYFDNDYPVSYPIPACTGTVYSFVEQYAIEVSSFDVDVLAPAIAQSILDGRQAVIRPVGDYTIATFKDDFFNHFYTLRDAINPQLPANEQLSNPLYLWDESSYQNALLLYLRNNG